MRHEKETTESTESPSTQRLSKVLAACGVASRRAAEEIIQSGSVRVNGVKILIPQTQVNIRKDIISVDGVCLEAPAEKSTYALHKPVGYVCTADPRVTRRAVTLIESDDPRLFTIGRLDKETSGLIIVTNDGKLAHRVMHPSFQIPKEYIAHVDKEILHEHLVAISKGIMILENDGSSVFVKPIQVDKVRKGTIRIVVCDGKKHEVRQMLISQGFEVRELKRVRIGGLRLGLLPVGAFKKLTQTEIEAITRETKHDSAEH